MSDEALRRELAYYKRHLDELAAQRISTEHHQWGLNVQLRQKRQGFQLLSQLARSIVGQTDVQSILGLTALAMNSALEMDRTIVFAPTATAHSYVPAHFAGVPDEVVRRVSQRSFVFPHEFRVGTGLLLVHTETEQTPLITSVREEFGLESFVCLPVAGHREPVGIIVSGRQWGHDAWGHSAFRALDDGDVDTFRAIGGLLQAIVQNTRLALLEQTERLKAQFFADIAHEFRTPLTLTLGPLAQLLAGKWGDLADPMKERLRVVERNQQRLLALINQILDLARLEAGAAELRAAPIANINDLVKDCAEHFRAAAEARGLELRLNLDARLEARPLLGDREKLERAIFNLLSNALKFTEHGHIAVTTLLRDDVFELGVEDTGIGMADADLPHIFDRFRRAAPATRSTQGSGIGLALVKQMVELHGGRVVARSRKGSGARFTITLPWRAPSATDEDVPGSESAAAPRSSRTHAARFPQNSTEPNREGAIEEANREAEAAFDASKPIVLYVEDDGDLRAYVRDILAESNNLFVARDGVDGLEKARRYLPDVILTDQMMPRMGGREFLLALRDDRDLQSIPVVFLTAQYGTEGRIESLDAGADDYLTKPFDENELRVRLRNIVRARKHERELAKLNERLEMRVREQVAELVRKGELERFLPRAVVNSVLDGSTTGRKETEKRHLTVLVTELTALSALGDLQEPSLASLANEYLGAISTVAAARGGTIDGLTGGRVSILFGAPLGATREGAALAAFETAVEIRSRTTQLAADAYRRGVRANPGRGIGLASGPCLVGAFGNDALRAYTAIGPAPRIAAILHADAAPTSIVCDRATWLLLKKCARARQLDHAKGSGDPSMIERYELTELPCSAEKEQRPSSLPNPTEVSASEPTFRREGEYWTVACAGRVFRLRDSKGAWYLARLLARPHVEIHVVDLAQNPLSDERRALTPMEAAELDLHSAPGRPAALLDGRAKAAYRKRLEDLDEELSEATNFRDTERVARAEAEKALLARELASAVGLGGRDRKTAASAERFRVNVTRALKVVIQKISLENPELGRHLAVSIRTGSFCSYAPPPGAPDAWNVSC
jgi:signal transduction histidine kinase/DNA-binding response OmpR family regulator